MSGPNTALQYFLRDSVVTMDDDAPVSALRTWTMRQNLQHLIDMSPQHRVNWTGASAQNGAFVFVSTQDDPRIYSALFPHTWINRRFPCGLDIQICGKTASGTLSVDARLVPHVLGSGVLDVVNDPYWTATGTTTSTTSAQIVSSMYYPGVDTPKRAGWRSYTVIEDGKAKSVKVCMSRLDITVTRTGGNSTDPAGLTRVSVREFC
jgi:hypothetical protein